MDSNKILCRCSSFLFIATCTLTVWFYRAEANKLELAATAHKAWFVVLCACFVGVNVSFFIQLGSQVFGQGLFPGNLTTMHFYSNDRL